jgi:hypothetical protein
MKIKKLMTAFALTIISAAAHAQMFDGFIDGAGLGHVNDIVNFYKEKGYKEVKSKDYPNSPIIFLLGRINKDDVLILINRKDEDSTDIKKITIFFPESKIASKEYHSHRQEFIKKFGVPTGIKSNSSSWVGIGTDDIDNYIYTIGIEDNHVFHSLERKN